ncbi:hypothetical protein LCGC14_0220530 [marine sediment metagenome]|uniref:Uncharacterized protein n=1 Tax=marine sediment metagenome TaxID=412755 RepID=A0A0F9UUK8_9ZZZZ
MTESNNKKRGHGPIVHKVFNDRGLHLERVHLDSLGSNLNHGRPVVIGQGENGEDISVKIGQKCPRCKMRVRGFNHANGAHHKGTVVRHSH